MIGSWREDAAPGDPWTNMATDEALFQEVVRGEASSPLVRVYRWDRPSVSIGRLQNEAVVHRAFPGLPSVRRPTGGRAVVHGDDLTVSVITRVEWLPDGAGGNVLSSYRRIAQGLMEAFAAVGVNARLGEAGRPEASQRGVVDCFALTAGCDLVDSGTGRKLVGSAQRREYGALLQQMSIPLGTLSEAGVFLGHLRAGLGWALGVTEWVSVDFTPPV